MSPLRFKYQTIEFDTIDIHCRTLRDSQEFFDKDDIALKLGISESMWAIFGVVWPSSEVLAHLMLSLETENKRILEVGCGIGLTSLLLNHINQNITATDYHPEVEGYLEINTELNNDKKIPFVRTAWEDTNKELGEFDLIIGSDLLYERDHIELLSSFINNHVKEHCEVIIIDPGRGNHSKFSKKMVELGFEHTQYAPENTQSYLNKPFKGKVLHYKK